ncbi:hypothetical protein BQ8794_220149 [Mesorhizobium prunaredense]|uniref:Tn3 transposase DDE domain-containing protein n=1 Tax=Mesorhizobium prunaredense TaxID=1631249 RepID=A0A1R3V6Q8_9HYPH|nr:hypothetical protein BQ8794_220149 [Mesorhizobium prunaredense]
MGHDLPLKFPGLRVCKVSEMLATLTDCPNESALLAAILADATNLGLSRMAAASQGVTRDQLVWTQDAYVREDTYRAAPATIINAQHRLPIAAVWGDGTTSSSDGQFGANPSHQRAGRPSGDPAKCRDRQCLVRPGLRAAEWHADLQCHQGGDPFLYGVVARATQGQGRSDRAFAASGSH